MVAQWPAGRETGFIRTRAMRDQPTFAGVQFDSRRKVVRLLISLKITTGRTVAIQTQDLSREVVHLDNSRQPR